MQGRIHPEAVRPQLDPEGRRLLQLPAHRFLFQIQIRHARPENAFIVPLRPRHRMVVFILLFSGKMIIPRIRTGFLVNLLPRLQPCQIFAGGLKPGMLRGGMIYRHIDDQADVPLPAILRQPPEILRRAVLLVHAAVIRHVIFVVGRRGHHRHEPDSRKSHVLYVIQLLRHAVQIPGFVPVRIVKGGDKDLIIIPVIVIRYDDLPFRPLRFILSPGQGFFRLFRRVRSPVSAAGKQQDDTENRQQARRPAADPSAGFRFLYSRAENLFFHSALLHIRYPFTAPPVTPST